MLTGVSSIARIITAHGFTGKALAPNRIKPDLKSDKVLYLCIKQF